MASVRALKKNMRITVTGGSYEGHEGFIVTGEIVPDGEEEQRKMLVNLTDLHTVDGEGFETYILPRQLEPFVDSIHVSPVAKQSGPMAALTTATVAELPQAEDITDPMDPALDRFRPDSNVVNDYVRREVPGGYVDIDYMLAMRDQRDARGFSPNVALVGETQSGKTMLVQVLAVLAAERDGMPKPYPVFTINGSSAVTSYDLYGMTSAVIINGVETLVHMEGLVPLAAKCGAFLYLDEWNAVQPAQAVAIHPLLDDRRNFVNTQKAVPDGHGGFSPEIVNALPGTKDSSGQWVGGMWILATINPGYKGTQTMAEATSNRFRWLPWDYDEATEKALVPSKTIRIIGDHLRESRKDRMVTVPVGTSALQRFMHDCSMFGVDNALWAFIGLFPPNERARVSAIIEDGGMEDLLREEYPTPLFGGKYGDDIASPGRTWDPDSLTPAV